MHRAFALPSDLVIALHALFTRRPRNCSRIMRTFRWNFSAECNFSGCETGTGPVLEKLWKEICYEETVNLSLIINIY